MQNKEENPTTVHIKPWKKAVKSVLTVVKLLYIVLPLLLIFMKGIPGLVSLAVLILARRFDFFLDNEELIVTSGMIMGFVVSIYASKFSWKLMKKGVATKRKHKILFFLGLVISLIGWFAGEAVKQITLT